MHKWTDEQYQFLADNIKGTPYKKMTEMFNAHFNTDLSVQKVNAALQRKGLTNDLKTTFAKGHTPFNKGLKGWQAGGNSRKTQFKKGRVSENYKPLGSERIDKRYGYTLIKIGKPDIWEAKHHYIWKRSGREIPENSVLIFADGDKTNVTLDNLMLISRGQLAVMNRHNLMYKDKELNKVALNIVEMMMKIKERRRSF